MSISFDYALLGNLPSRLTFSAIWDAFLVND